MRLSGNDGSYSHIAVAFSMAAIWVMQPITATLAMLTMWPKQLKTKDISLTERKRKKTNRSWFSSAFQVLYRLHVGKVSTVEHVVLLFKVLSRVIIKSWGVSNVCQGESTVSQQMYL
jgi:hypothetical protein